VVFGDNGRKELGRTGEEIAAAFLKKKGFRILEQNYRCRLGEVDLIVEKEDAILFVEVKTRRSVDTVSPLELISRGKQFHISRVAQYYLAKKRFQEKSASFALLVVDWSGPAPSVELIENAFLLAWGY
jgi:putative endonuclease